VTPATTYLASTVDSTRAAYTFGDVASIEDETTAKLTAALR